MYDSLSTQDFTLGNSSLILSLATGVAREEKKMVDKVILATEILSSYVVGLDYQSLPAEVI